MQSILSKKDNKKQLDGTIKKVNIGSEVRIYFYGSGREDTYKIVPFNGDIKEHTISMQSPLAVAILGKEEGNEVIFSVGDNKNKIKILKIN
jgi:transcription elongation GreA/GreB family factor